jgi:hypothetical protein
MSPIAMISYGLALATTLAVVSVLLLGRPLHSLLVELCGNEARARFWLVMASLLIVLMTLFGVLVSLPLLPPHAQSISGDERIGREMLAAVRMGIFGLLVALGALSFVLLLAINGYERNTRRQMRDPNWMQSQ